MSEEYPLLQEELSEEDRFSPCSHRRLLMSRGRARNQVKGAAVIITRWPEHWTTLLNYWWVGLGMLALTTYIMYNFLFSYALLQPTYKVYPKPINIKASKLIPKPSLPPKVFMHIFVDEKQEVDLNNYLPYIEIVTKKYKSFKYELVIVANDTNSESKDPSDKENNELALNMLWADDFSYKKIITNHNNLNIKYVTLSNYLFDSPLKKYWNTLPHQFIKFLVRAVSIWEKGGIAFDPIVLTPQSPHSAYIDKVYNILKKYKAKKEKEKPPPKNPMEYITSKKMNKIKPKPNNIRDIINALQSDGTTEKFYQEPLVVAESKDNLTVTFGRKLRSVADINDDIEVETNTMSPLIETKNVEFNDITLNQEKQLDSSSKFNLLPMFLDYLFHNKQTKHPDVITTTSAPKQAHSQHKAIEKSNENKSLKMRDFWSELMVQNNDKPMVISAKGIFGKSGNETKLADVIEKEVEHLFEVTIDLKGNIIATDTACHAFIGNMFTNAIHHDQSESVTDFIIKELSIFCKGLFASCVGIDVILL